MLSVSEETIRAGNRKAHLGLYGQEYNDEAWAICCSDMLIKDEETDQIILGDTLGDGKTRDGFPGKQFHYMLANPPFGVEWKDQQRVVEKEANELGFSGRFGAGLPAINDGSLLFLQHMISKMKDPPEKQGEGSKIAIVFNGSPLFSHTTSERVDVAQSAIAQAEENVRVVRDRYVNGLAPYTEVLDAETLRVTSENNQANAVYDVVIAGLRLKYAVGEL
jgi:type I restriction-modification system DNA methylase subunit